MNTSSEKQLTDLLYAFETSIKKDVEVKIPCEVTEVISRTKVSIRPLIKIVTRDGTTKSREVIEGVPVFAYGAGDRVLSFPVNVGDKGWLEASDRDISVFLQSFDESEPTTKRMHSFSDGLFVPDIMTNYSLSSEDENAAVLQNKDGSVKIALDDEEIRLNNNGVKVTISDSQVEVINGGVSAVITSSMVTGVAPGGFNFNGFVISADGSATSPVSVGAPALTAAISLSVAGVEQAEHVHGGVETGTSNTLAAG